MGEEVEKESALAPGEAVAKVGRRQAVKTGAAMLSGLTLGPIYSKPEMMSGEVRETYLPSSPVEPTRTRKRKGWTKKEG